MVSDANIAVLVMTSVHPWDDPRIFYKEVVSLAKKYKVELHAPAAFKVKDDNMVKIVGLPQYKKRYLRPLNWIRLGFRAWKSKAYIVHFHDPELIIVGLFLKLFTSKRIIYDIHEDLPASFLSKPWVPKIFRPFLGSLADFWERKCCSFFDSLIFAEFSYQARFIHTSVRKEYIANYPLRSLGCLPQFHEKFSDEVTMVYGGKISIVRGIRELIESLKLVKKAGFKFHCYLVGDWISSNLRKEMTELIDSLGMTDNVTVTGKISFPKVWDYYQKADIGLALLHPEKNYIHSLPTKIYEYMAAGIPVLGSNFPLWENLVKNHQCGITANPLDVSDIAQKLMFLLKNKGIRRKMGVNGYQAFFSVYNWDTQEEKLWKLYQELSVREIWQGDRV